jgi:hypothetical protein
MIHNRYRYQGGEDAVCQAESDGLLRYGNAGERVVFESRGFADNLDSLKLGLRGV